MSDSFIEITRKHGKEMHILGMRHALEMARLFRDHGDEPIAQLIKHLEEKLVEESVEHDRFSEKHRNICLDCRDAYEDFVQDSNDDARLDALSEE